MALELIKKYISLRVLFSNEIHFSCFSFPQKNHYHAPPNIWIPDGFYLIVYDPPNLSICRKYYLLLEKIMESI